MSVPAKARFALALGAALAACSAKLPVPPLGPHTGDTPVIVPYPPPAARVEIVPPGLPEQVWIDGQWEWQARRWVWRAGVWEKPVPAATYAPPVTVRLSDGTLAWFEGRWHAPDVSKPR
jgi:hypothetical protein